MNNLIQQMTYCTKVSVPGVSEIYMKSKSELLGYWKYEETNNLQYGKITGIQNQIGSWYKIVSRRQSLNANQVQNNDLQRTYSQTLDFGWNYIEYYKRDIIEQMVVSDDIVVVYKDNNQKWWLIGETNGCSVLTWNFGTGINATGNNETTLQFTNTERYPIREVDISFINNITPTLLAICDLTWAEYCALDWNTICNDYAWTN